MKITILCGIPCSGKSFWANNSDSYLNGYPVSRDDIRKAMYGKGYKQNKRDEKYITTRFNMEVGMLLSSGYDVILDNTHCKEGYIDEIIAKYPDYDIQIKFFDIPLWKAYLRNIIRYIEWGKWIPFKVIKNMKKNYNKINREKYGKYILV